MNRRFLALRVGWTAFAAWLFLTLLFLFLAFTPDPNEALVGWAAGGGEEGAEAQAAYRAVRGRNRPLLARYGGWLVSFLTLNFGPSFAYEASVTEVLSRSIPRTVAYLVPGVVVASALSLASGTAAALRGGRTDRATRALGYLCLSLPAFVLGEGLIILAGETDFGLDALLGYTASAPVTSTGNLLALAPAALVLGVNLYGAQVLWVRTETRDILAEEFVKMLRANGVSPRRVYEHVLRNAASPLLALVVSEVLVVLFVTIYVVEVVLGIPGLGMVSFRGFMERDFGLILTTVTLLVSTALVANLAMDVVSAAIDPRVSGGEG
ncbi:ABC transporter permease [Halorarum halobium]|uniref:ABC transporter permease n=1 Tax=Halorarum halobium TaxID=3075121 RepID=UPI0028AF98D3|nr:ABC transporter permease [Halobaculum sp. XH14]